MIQTSSNKLSNTNWGILIQRISMISNSTKFHKSDMSWKSDFQKGDFWSKFQVLGQVKMDMTRMFEGSFVDWNQRNKIWFFGCFGNLKYEGFKSELVMGGLQANGECLDRSFGIILRCVKGLGLTGTRGAMFGYVRFWKFEVKWFHGEFGDVKFIGHLWMFGQAWHDAYDMFEEHLEGYDQWLRYSHFLVDWPFMDLWFKGSLRCICWWGSKQGWFKYLTWLECQFEMVWRLDLGILDWFKAVGI